jgi:hypothetical protein
MTTLVLGSPPPELEALLERRRLAGVDRLDEVWQGVHHMAPGPSLEHARGVDEVLLANPLERTSRGSHCVRVGISRSSAAD